MIKYKYKIYNCNNLELLSTLDDNSIDMIYGDILYGTGRNFGEYQDIKSDKWSVRNTYFDFLIEAHRVLKETGVIVLQMDYRINYKIRSLLDEIFGEDHFRDEIIWAYNSAPRKKNHLGNRHDTIYVYSKGDNITFNELREPYSDTAPRGYAKEKYYNPQGKVIGDVWDIPILGQNDKTERTGYPTQKPVKLIERIINIYTKPDDLILDPYVGSGTTVIAALNTGRRCIGCDSSKAAIEVIKERLHLNEDKEIIYIKSR